MAKGYYRVPVSLNRSFLDHEISLSSSGMQAKAMPIKVLLFWGGSLFVLMWSQTSTFLGDGGFWLSTFLVIWWIAATAFFGGVTKTREMKFKTVPALLAYAPKAARNIVTRRSADPSEFASIVGIREIAADGRISFYDGTVGMGYLVVGSASVLVFDEDKTAILDRVDAFWRKVDTSAEFIFITTKEPQRIFHQVASLERRNLALEVRDPDLVELMNEQFDILTEHVGGRFNSIHQYLIIKADNAEALRAAHTVLQAEVEGSGLMIKEAMVLNREDLQRVLRVFYTGCEALPSAG